MKYRYHLDNLYASNIHKSIFTKFRIKRKINGQLRTETRQLRQAFNDMDMLRSPAQSVDALLRGLTDDRSEAMDSNFVDDVRAYNS